MFALKQIILAAAGAFVAVHLQGCKGGICELLGDEKGQRDLTKKEVSIKTHECLECMAGEKPNNDADSLVKAFEQCGADGKNAQKYVDNSSPQAIYNEIAKTRKELEDKKK